MVDSVARPGYAKFIMALIASPTITLRRWSTVTNISQFFAAFLSILQRNCITAGSASSDGPSSCLNWLFDELVSRRVNDCMATVAWIESSALIVESYLNFPV
jgi:hypothetical protein